MVATPKARLNHHIHHWHVTTIAFRNVLEADFLGRRFVKSQDGCVSMDSFRIAALVNQLWIWMIGDGWLRGSSGIQTHVSITSCLWQNWEWITCEFHTFHTGLGVQGLVVALILWCIYCATSAEIQAPAIHSHVRSNPWMGTRGNN